MIGLGLVRSGRVLSLVALSLATPVIHNLQVHESIGNAPTGFSLKGYASPATMLNLQVALVQNDLGGLIDKLTDISTPSSSNYGKWLSKEEVRIYLIDSSTNMNMLTMFNIYMID